MRKFFWIVVLGVLGSSGQAAEITVFAAASLTDSLKEIAVSYEKKTGDHLIFSFAASSFLARQIEEGAPADLFFSADEAKMDALEKKGRIDVTTRRSPLSNALVLAVARESALKITNSLQLAETRIHRVALADPKTVPAGIYAREHLEKVKVWASVEPKVIPTENVRGALAAVESGNVEVGMVYKTDAAISTKVKVAYEVPASETPNISYSMAVVKESKNAVATKKLLHYLESEEAGATFSRFGFIVRKKPTP